MSPLWIIIISHKLDSHGWTSLGSILWCKYNCDMLIIHLLSDGTVPSPDALASTLRKAMHNFQLKYNKRPRLDNAGPCHHHCSSAVGSTGSSDVTPKKTVRSVSLCSPSNDVIPSLAASHRKSDVTTVPSNVMLHSNLSSIYFVTMSIAATSTSIAQPRMLQHKIHWLHPEDLMVAPVNTQVCLLIPMDYSGYKDFCTLVLPFQPSLPNITIDNQSHI